ncbi:MAG: anti-sigma factor [Thermostichales cyanobacterium SZTDM-1c_bins_54]
MAEPTDFEIMLQVQRRMPQAFSLLQERYQSRLFGICRGLGCSVQESAQVVQQVWAFVWKHADQFDLERERSVALWLYELAAFYSQQLFANRRQYRQRLVWVGVGTVVLVGLAQMTPAMVAALHQGAVNLARAWVGSPDLQVLERQWRQDARTQIFRLQGAEPELEGLWSGENRQVLLITRGIPTPPPGQIYQLWAISPQAGGETLLESGGTFSGEASHWLSNTFLTSQPQRLLVSRERQPGSLRPGEVIVWDSAPPPVELPRQLSFKGN